MKFNNDKYHLLWNTPKQNIPNIRNFTIKNLYSEKLLYNTFDWKLKFINNIEDMCKKATQKLNALSRKAAYLDICKRKMLMNVC